MQRWVRLYQCSPPDHPNLYETTTTNLVTLCNVRYDALQCTLLHICEIFTRRCSRSSSVAPLSQIFRPRRCPRQRLSMLPADDTRLGHTLQCERIAWGDEVFSTGCSVRFHREDYEGWNWKSRAEHNSDTGVRTPAPPLGGAWVTFAWNGPHTGALLQRWICASDITRFVSFQAAEPSTVLSFVAFKLRQPEDMVGNVPLHCFDTHGRQMLDPQSRDHKAYITCEVSHSAHTAFITLALPWLREHARALHDLHAPVASSDVGICRGALVSGGWTSAAASIEPSLQASAERQGARIDAGWDDGRKMSGVASAQTPESTRSKHAQHSADFETRMRACETKWKLDGRRNTGNWKLEISRRRLGLADETSEEEI